MNRIKQEQSNKEKGKTGPNVNIQSGGSKALRQKYLDSLRAKTQSKHLMTMKTVMDNQKVTNYDSKREKIPVTKDGNVVEQTEDPEDGDYIPGQESDGENEEKVIEDEGMTMQKILELEGADEEDLEKLQEAQVMDQKDAAKEIAHLQDELNDLDSEEESEDDADVDDLDEEEKKHREAEIQAQKEKIKMRIKRRRQQMATMNKIGLIEDEAELGSDNEMNDHLQKNIDRTKGDEIEGDDLDDDDEELIDNTDLFKQEKAKDTATRARAFHEQAMEEDKEQLKKVILRNFNQ